MRIFLVQQGAERRADNESLFLAASIPKSDRWASPRRGIVQIELPSTYAGEGRKEVRSHQRTVAVDRRMDIGHVAVRLCQR